MISKKKRIQVYRTDMNTGVRQRLADGVGELSEDRRLTYREALPSGCRVEVEAGEDQLTIRRYGEAHTTLILRRDERSLTRVETAEGILEIENQTELLELSSECWRVVYRSGELERFQFEWWLKEAEA